jgi:hypothetical protein
MNMTDLINRFSLVDIDFRRPWWYPILLYKKLFISLVILRIIITIYTSSLIFLVGFVLNSGDFKLIYALLACTVLYFILERTTSKLNQIYKFATVHSVQYSANKIILEADPIVHSTKSTGKLISKVSRGSTQFHGLLDATIYQIGAWIVQLLTISFSLLYYNFMLGLVSFVGLSLVCLVSVYFKMGIFRLTKDPLNLTRENMITAMVQNISQVLLIRSTFQTKSRQELLQQDAVIGSEAEYARSVLLLFSSLITHILYTLVVLGVFLYLSYMVQTGTITQVVAISLLTNFAVNGNVTTQFGKIARVVTEAATKISDLFEIMSTFGQKTYTT